MCNILGAGCGPPTNFIDWTYFNSLAAVFIVTVSIEIWLLFLLWCEWYDWIWFFFSFLFLFWTTIFFLLLVTWRSLGVTWLFFHSDSRRKTRDICASVLDLKLEVAKEFCILDEPIVILSKLIVFLFQYSERK